MTVASRPKRLGRPPAIDSAETRQKILDAARRAFARKGYDATTNKDIAEDVGITTGAIYHYFASKADLYVAVYEEVQVLIYDVFEKAIVPFTDFPERLSAALDAAVEINLRDSSIAGFVVGVPDERARHEHLRERIARLQGRSRTFFGGLVDDAKERGELAPDVTCRVGQRHAHRRHRRSGPVLHPGRHPPAPGGGRRAQAADRRHAHRAGPKARSQSSAVSDRPSTT